jgi:hypothetical protein
MSESVSRATVLREASTRAVHIRIRRCAGEDTQRKRLLPRSMVFNICRMGLVVRTLRFKHEPGWRSQ